MRCFSYIVARDYGFAPNPFHSYCTLATCKPKIRRKAVIGDWVVGLAPGSYKDVKLVYLMQVDEKLTYNEYWEDIRFQIKKPYMYGPLVKAYGDNIYRKDLDSGIWTQADSHHSYDQGVTNKKNLYKDTSSEYVLISKRFYYFGRDIVEVPNHINSTALKIKRNHRNISDETKFMPLIEWVSDNFRANIIYNSPKMFEINRRYSGN